MTQRSYLHVAGMMGHALLELEAQAFAETVRLALTATVLGVTRSGTRKPIPSRYGIESFLKSHP